MFVHGHDGGTMSRFRARSCGAHAPKIGAGVPCERGSITGRPVIGNARGGEGGTRPSDCYSELLLVK